MTHPLIAWDSDIDDPDVVWHSRLDGRYHIEVVRVNSHAGELRIFDHDAGDEMVHSVSVGLMYGAQFGPDMDDVAEWRLISTSFVDSLHVDLDVHT